MYGLAEYGAALYAGPRVQSPPADTATHTAIEVSFTTGALETPVWVDVTEDCRAWSVARGRSRELERFQPGRATITLSNLDRQYDSSNAAGPWAGNLVPRRRVRIRETFAGVTYPVFDGYINQWVLDYPGTGKDAAATIVATDAMMLLNGSPLGRSVYDREIRSDAPLVWWRLDDGNDVGEGGANVANTGTGGDAYEGEAVGFPKMGSAPLIVRDSGGSMGGYILDDTGNTLTVGVRLPNAAFDLLSLSEFTVEVWCRSSATVGVGDTAWVWGVSRPADSAGRAVCGYLNDPGITDSVLQFLIANTVGTVYGVQTAPFGFTPGQITHVVCTKDAAGAMRITVNGVPSTALAAGATATTFAGTLPTGRDFSAGVDLATPVPGEKASYHNWEGELAQVAVYSRVLSDLEIATHYVAGVNPWQSDIPVERIDRILDAADWPADLRVLDAGEPTLQSAAIEGQSVLEHLQKVGETEFGLVFIDRAGNVRFIGQDAIFDRTPHPPTIGDGADMVGFTTIRFDDGDMVIRNSATISRLNGAARTDEDSASITAYGRFEYVLDGLLHQADDYSDDYADFIVSEYKDPRRRVVQLTLGPPINGEEADVYGQILARELGDAVTVSHQPPGGGDPFEQVCVIEGISIAGTPTRGGGLITATWTLSPEYTGSF